MVTEDKEIMLAFEQFRQTNENLVRINEKAIDGLVEAVRALAHSTSQSKTTVNPLFPMAGPPTSPFDSIPKEDKEMLKEMMKHMPRAIDAVEKHNKEKEEEEKEWKDKLKGGNKK